MFRISTQFLSVVDGLKSVGMMDKWLSMGVAIVKAYGGTLPKRTPGPHNHGAKRTVIQLTPSEAPPPGWVYTVHNKDVILYNTGHWPAGTKIKNMFPPDQYQLIQQDLASITPQRRIVVSYRTSYRSAGIGITEGIFNGEVLVEFHSLLRILPKESMVSWVDDFWIMVNGGNAG